jgi:hypothetical protein
MRLRLRHHELALLAVVIVTVPALGAIVARDLRQSARDATALYEHLASSLDLVDELQFRTQEVRRTLLYALHTSDANLQLQYAEQSRAAEREVQQLFRSSSRATENPGELSRLQAVQRAWVAYLHIRDDVIGLILEGSLPEGVSQDEHEGTERFNAVRRAIAELKETVQYDAAVQARAARARADLATVRLTAIVLSALCVRAGALADKPSGHA